MSKLRGGSYSSSKKINSGEKNVKQINKNQRSQEVEKMKTGWWKLNITWTDEDMDEHMFLNDTDREHIAECIKEGYREGEIIQEDEKEV